MTLRRAREGCSGDKSHEIITSCLSKGLSNGDRRIWKPLALCYSSFSWTTQRDDCIFVCTTFPVTATPRALPQQGSPRVATKGLVQNLPRQVFYRPFVFLLLLGSCLVTVFIVPLLFLCFLWSWIDVRGKNNSGGTSGMARDWSFELRWEVTEF